MTDLAPIAARVAAATPTTGKILVCGVPDLGWDIEGPESGIRGQFEREEDAQFHAHATGDVRWLLDRIQDLEAELAHYRDDRSSRRQIDSSSSC